MEDWKNKKILIVEDEMANFMYISEILEETGIQITHAVNGKKAIENFNQETFDLILMDLKMPLMDGFEATIEIRKLNKKIVIVAQTAYAYKREECIAKGFTDYISKPFNQVKLLQLLKKYIDQQGQINPDHWLS